MATKKQLQAKVRKERKRAEEKINLIIRRGKYSHAADKLEEFYRSHGKKAVSATSKRDLERELRALESFKEAKTSTLKGIAEVHSEMSKRVFGVNPETGRANRYFRKDEATKFFEEYNKFISTYKTAWSTYTSERIQRVLGAVKFDRGLDYSKLATALDKVKKEELLYGTQLSTEKLRESYYN